MLGVVAFGLDGTLFFFVGSGASPLLARLAHRPAGDIAEIAREVLARWTM